MKNKIAFISGDGVGPSLMKEALKVLNRVSEVFEREFVLTECEAGQSAQYKYGNQLPQKTVQACLEADAVLLGGVELEKPCPSDQRKMLLRMRQELGLITNVRPVSIPKSLWEYSTMRRDVLERGFHIFVARDLKGGTITNPHERSEGAHGRVAVDFERYDEQIIRECVADAFAIAGRSRGKAHLVCKCKGLASSILWRDVAFEMKEEYPEISLQRIEPDDCAYEISRDPSQFDVVFGINTYGDILSDQASGLTGAARTLGAFNTMAGGKGLYERNLFSDMAYDEVGKDSYNPIGMIRAAALMLQYSLEFPEAAAAIDRAIEEALLAGYATADLMREGKTLVGTSGMGDAIAARVRK